ncbi:hypothetical protein BDV98DRAFT_538274 [Pterulicium gracile]|uniref:Uncharacterized protein n=1 Tax=Pterulicium gracile TaxID=1884261 RepID=A0A5C3R035_9AGAR|nr:hypothetical protein BDV98DRAFT_538274 [Pterula gracilis]
MGSASSKAARTLPKRVQNVAPSVTRVKEPVAPAAHTEMASETKSSDIEKDSIDPHFAANLSRLGAVRVNHNMQTLQTSAQHRQQFDAQLKSEHEADSVSVSRGVPNRVLGTTLAELLEKRKYASSVEELEASLRGSGLDRAALERLAKHVNTPTAKEGATFKTVSPEGDETITSTAAWIEPSSLR